MTIPEFNTKFICISDRNNGLLTAVISSYVQINESYLSIFEFPPTSNEKPKFYTDKIDEHTMSSQRAEIESINIRNGIKKIGGCEYLIIAGLNSIQKSYLNYLDEFNVIEINTIDDIDICLGAIVHDKKSFFHVLPEQIHIGLLLASKSNMKIRIDESASSINIEKRKDSGLLIIENNETVSVVSAINYAYSANLDIEIIEPIEENEKEEIKTLIEDWKNGNESSAKELQSKLYSRLDSIDISCNDFVTFFTVGVPYSLVLKNEIPCSYVHLNFNPNQIIVNSIFFEKRNIIGSAVVFSPTIFGEDEETINVINSFKKNNYHVKELIGNNATSYNMDMYIKEYPFDFFHICSHGGEINGFSVTKEFEDRDGNKHIIEYDDIINFYPEKGEDKIKLEHKHIWRRFDGFKWMSKELNEQNYQHHVFADMINSIAQDDNKKYKGIPKGIIPNSCAIKCSDFIYQALFDMLASLHTSPIIFNNTCWSANGISDTFLNCGARGYIGTLWSVKNIVAKEFAEEFCMKIHDDYIIKVLNESNKKTKGTDSENVYIYWGLNFTTLKKADSLITSRNNIIKLMERSYYKWLKRASTHQNGITKDSIIRLAKWNEKVIKEIFTS